MRRNRSNALRSSGPRTPGGKRRASRNATRHGLLSSESVLPDEGPRGVRRLPGGSFVAPSPDAHTWYSGLAIRPQLPIEILAAGFSPTPDPRGVVLYRSTDDGASWKPSPTRPTSGGPLAVSAPPICWSGRAPARKKWSVSLHRHRGRYQRATGSLRGVGHAQSGSRCRENRVYATVLRTSRRLRVCGERCAGPHADRGRASRRRPGTPLGWSR